MFVSSITSPHVVLPGFLLFKDFCFNEIDEAVPQLKFYEEVRLTGGIRSGIRQSTFFLPGSAVRAPPLASVFQIKEYEKLDSEEERLSRSRQIYDVYIMKELLSCSHVRSRRRRRLKILSRSPDPDFHVTF